MIPSGGGGGGDPAVEDGNDNEDDNNKENVMDILPPLVAHRFERLKCLNMERDRVM